MMETVVVVSDMRLVMTTGVGRTIMVLLATRLVRVTWLGTGLG